MESDSCSSPKKALSATFHFHSRHESRPIFHEIKTRRNFQTQSSSPIGGKKRCLTLEVTDGDEDEEDETTPYCALEARLVAALELTAAFDFSVMIRSSHSGEEANQ